MRSPLQLRTPAPLVALAMAVSACNGPLIPPSGSLSVGMVPSANAIPVGGAVTFGVSAARPGNPANIFIENIRVDFGDGQAVDLGAAVRGGTLGAEGSVTHTYLQAGTFVASATATDSVGTQGRTSLTILVTPAAPPAAPSVGLIANATTPTPVGSAVVFTVTASVPGASPGSSDAIRSIRLDFGDGQAVDLGASAPSAGVSHIYSSAGTYTATATATSTGGAQARASTTILVSGILRTPTPSVGLTSNAGNPTAIGTSVQFTVSASIPGGAAGVAIRSIRLDFGDGQFADLGAVPTGPVSHTYSQAGNYSATAVAVDTNGNQGSASLAIVVR